MARTDRPGLDTPRSARRRLPQVGMPPDTFGRVAEGIARYMGTPMFLVLAGIAVPLCVAFAWIFAAAFERTGAQVAWTRARTA